MLPIPPNQDARSWSQLLARVQMPGRYVGGEVNQVLKEPADVDLRWALIYPDAYEIGSAHQGLRILYHCLNSQDAFWAERCFTPWPDMEAELKKSNTPLCTLESQTPLSDLDVVGFTLQTELTYTNLLNTLDLGGIPVRSRDRDSDAPLVVAGGAGVLNPEPLADFVDLFFLGDGEQAVVSFSETLRALKPKHKGDRHGLLRALIKACPFLYAPRFWKPTFDGPKLKAMIPLEEVGTPRRAIVYDLENAPYPTEPVVPSVRTIHDRITIEIMRGCVEGCRFCQAGIEKRPQRFRSVERVLEIAKASYRSTGLNEIGLTSLSSSDHPDIFRMMDVLTSAFLPHQVSLSLPSLRVNEAIHGITRRMADVRKRGLTLAPEVATDRLRGIINKGIRDIDLFEGAHSAWKLGYSKMKLYFMIGIPGETDEDIDGIKRMAERVSLERKNAGCGGPGHVNAAVSTFIPKALTPFQWHAQMRPEEVREKQSLLRSGPRMRAVNIQCHVSNETLLEGFFSRADRRSCEVLYQAWKSGARFDAWSDLIDISHWEKAWEATAYGPEETMYRERDIDEVFPWDHLDLGVTRAFLRKEWEKAMSQELTEHCQTGACSSCGVGATVCVDIKALAGLEKYAKPKLIQRAQSNRLFESEKVGVNLEAKAPRL